MKKINLLIGITSIVIVVILSIFLLIKDKSINVSSADIKEIISKQIISRIEIDNECAFFYDSHERVYKLPLSEFDLSYIKGSPVIAKKSNFLQETFSIFGMASLFLIIIITIILNIKNMNKNIKDNKKLHTKEERENRVFQKEEESLHSSIHHTRSNVKFSDIAGIKEAKEELLEIIDYLKFPKKYQDLNINLPKGAILVGPPGVGKTMIAKAVAGEAGVPFFYQSGSSFVHIYVGMGAKRVRELFSKARIYAPSIIFIDEIDALGKARGTNRNDEREATLNELLSEMDGFEDRSGVIVLAATNQIEVLDSALLRSGRFDRRIYVDLPDVFEREDIIKVYLKNKKHNVNPKEIAKLCVGFSGANLASLINEAALNSVKYKRNEIIMQDIVESSEKIMQGKKRQSSLNNSQKRSVAIYNAGKAISSYWLLNDFQKISLVNAINFEQSYNMSTRSELLNRIKISLSGNLALELNNLEPLTIAKNDIKIAKDIAKEMCEIYGMGSRILTTDGDILFLIEDAVSEHRDFIYSNKNNIIKIANALIEREKLSREDIALLININDESGISLKTIEEMDKKYNERKIL